jgi:tyrosinase
MLHHCNVDRLVAMWQAIHYDEAMFTGTASSTGQYATPKDSPITADSPLKPFFTANMTFHTSRSVANITTFGYTYPELPSGGATMPPEARANHVRAQVNSLYSRGGANGVGLTRAAAAAAVLYPNKAGYPESESEPEPESKNYYYYTAEIVLNRSEMALPAMLRLVVGGRVVGRLSLLAMPREGAVTVSLPLRDVLVGNRSVRDFPVGQVVLFLQRSLRAEIWTVRSLFLALRPKRDRALGADMEAYCGAGYWLTDAPRRVMAPRYPSPLCPACSSRSRASSTCPGPMTRASLFLGRQSGGRWRCATEH